MMEKKWKIIRVSKRVKPIHYSLRPPLSLELGKDYYVSFCVGQAYHCRLTNIYEERRRIEIEIPRRPSRSWMERMSRKRIPRQQWREWLSVCEKEPYSCVDVYLLFPDEIGCTPEEAVTRQVTL